MITEALIRSLIAIVVGYLLGSIPCGLWLGKIFYHVDIREYGSGRTGATNVLRTCGKVAFVLSIIGDFGKAYLAVVLSTLILQDNVFTMGSLTINDNAIRVMAGIAAIVGHTWPIFANFRGGRGVSSFMGGLTALCPWAAIFAVAALIVVVSATKYMSLGSMVAVVGAYVIMIPLTLFAGYPAEDMAFVLVGTILVLLDHSDNIVRLVKGTERKVGQKEKI